MGWATPHRIERVVGAVRSAGRTRQIALHLHDTRGMAVANAHAGAASMGVTQFDTTVGGLGGCPFAGQKGAAGNICTEELVLLCEEMGIDTGVDLDKLIEVGRLAEEHRRPPAAERADPRRQPRRVPPARPRMMRDSEQRRRLPASRSSSSATPSWGRRAGLVLADLGADVIKVEPAPAGDHTRGLGGFAAGFFAAFNRNKRSLAHRPEERGGPGGGAPAGGDAPTSCWRITAPARWNAWAAAMSMLRRSIRGWSIWRSRAILPGPTSIARRSTRSCSSRPASPT